MQKNKQIINLSLGFSTEDPHLFLDGNYYTTNPVGKFFISLSDHVSDFSYSCPVKETKLGDPRISQRLEAGRKTIFFPRPFFFHKAEIFKSPILFVRSLVLINKMLSNVDILIYRVPSPFIFLLLFLSKQKKKKIIFYIAGDFHGRNIKAKSSIKRFLSFIYNKCEGLIASQGYIIATGYDLANKYNCENFFTSLVKNDDIETRRLEHNYSSIKIIYVGRIDRNKGVLDSVKAVHEIKKTTKDIVFNIIGSGNKIVIDQIEQYIKQHDLNDTIFLKGPIEHGPKLFEYFKNSNMFILPSYSEGIPKVLFEAMSFRIPIVTTNVGGIPSILKNNESALFVSPGDINGFIQAIFTLFRSPQVRRKLILETDRVIRSYSFENQQQKLLEIVNSRFNLL